MPDAVFADPAERLPWLPNIAPPPQPRRSTGKAVGLAGWAVAGALLIAGASYWLGTQSGKQPGTGGTVASSASGPDATLKLPEPRANVQPQVSIPHAPEVRPAPAPTVAVPESAPNQHKRPRLKREEPSTAKLDQAVKVQSDKPAAAPAKSPLGAAAKPQPLKLWPSRQVTGSSGRLVQIGAFGTRHQAKLGWRHMQRAYPAIGKLPAVVVEARNSRGRKFYRFQIGTTSHAHSEVLCQRMEKIDYSCAVLGLPWKAKIER